MVEGGGNEISEEDLLEAIFFGHRCPTAHPWSARRTEEEVAQLENDKRKAAAEPILPPWRKSQFPRPSYDPVLERPVLLADESLRERIRAAGQEKIRQALSISRKKARNEQLEKVRQETLAPLLEEFPEKAGEIKAYYEALEKFVCPPAHFPAKPADRWPRLQRSPPHSHPGGVASPDPRFGPVYPGRDPGLRCGHPGVGG